MRIKNPIISILLLAVFFIPDKIEAYSPNNAHSIMEGIIKKAGEEGKMILLEFYADWCTPCKWMQETVFQDREVRTRLASGYITKMVDIDDIDGYELKSLYEVQVLPTILIFNTKGKMVERIEKTIAKNDFLDILLANDNKHNRVKIKHSVNSSPNGKSDDIKETKAFQDNYLRYVETNNKTTRNYRLQMGIFENFENAFSKVDKLKNTFLEPIIVVNDYKNEKVRYKVMMGEFATLSEAESFRKILSKEFKLDAIIN